jgi:phytoene dehydrogenase-like protein
MIAFGRECVASTNWGGDVPITLVEAHYQYDSFSFDNEAAKEAYWKQPDVWPDIKSAYERYFELNPDDADTYKNYAWYAYHAGQWDAFNELAPKVPAVDYYFFGGKDAFDNMVRLAKGQLQATPGAP